MQMLTRKVKISGILVFDTAFHIGSGREGELATDKGVLLEPDGRPLLPGSSLKGSFRTTCERLAPHLGLNACLLDTAMSGVPCVNGSNDIRKAAAEALKSQKDKLAFLADHTRTCHVCQLFGSQLQASRIFFADATLLSWGGSLQIRDGVGIDRDSGTARDGLKYDLEVVPQEAKFSLTFDLENPNDQDLALVGAALAEWGQGVRLGGLTSRGLGRARLESQEVAEVNYADPKQLANYLIKREMTSNNGLLSTCLEQWISGKGQSLC